MSDIAIRVEGIGKQYRIGAQQAKYKTLRETLVTLPMLPVNAFRSLTRIRENGGRRTKESIWALKDVSFEVKRGEVVGIIGRNGAGKSTLLKILSSITEPTKGYADIYGRVGSLLEVGTGFHPELTGRENIYLNGAILGMQRAEIEKKFDEIVAFAEVEKFIDTPVKRYSSGMYLRLAFAVAAHLEPEILIVDEVLAVGDLNFQKKCMGKMNSVAKHGQTVLFVSHNLAAVRQLCSTTVLLERGGVRCVGDSDSVINTYLNPQESPGDAIVFTRDIDNRKGTGSGRIVRVGFFDESGEATNTVGVGKPFSVELEVELEMKDAALVAGLEIKQSDGTPLLNLRSDSQGISFKPSDEGGGIVINIQIPGLPLYPGRYIVEPWFADRQGQRIDHLYNSLWVMLESQGVYASELLIQPGRGIMFVDCQWSQREVASYTEV